MSEVAARWNMSVSTVLRSYVQTGRLRATRVGRLQLVSIDDLSACEEELVAELEERIEYYRQPYPKADAPPLASALPRPKRGKERTASAIRGIRKRRAV